MKLNGELLCLLCGAHQSIREVCGDPVRPEQPHLRGGGADVPPGEVEGGADLGPGEELPLLLSAVCRGHARGVNGRMGGGMGGSGWCRRKGLGVNGGGGAWVEGLGRQGKVGDKSGLAR